MKCFLCKREFDVSDKDRQRGYVRCCGAIISVKTLEYYDRQEALVMQAEQAVA